MQTLDNAIRAACALMLAGNVLLGAPARADTVLLGSDYLETVQPTFFIPLGPLNPLAGLPIGPGTTDTIVRRRGDCSLSLFGAGSNCTIPIEMVALSLISVVNPMVRLRESPTLQSTGMMTMTSDGSGTGGTFASFFDVFVELSLDGGLNFAPVPQLQLQSSGTQWTTLEQGLLVPGLFDHYQSFSPRPAAYFGLRVSRKPSATLATVHGGGLIASGPSGADRLPLPWAPPGLHLLGLEGAGEVQTPLTGHPAAMLAIGDLVWFRHAKSGELFEHVNDVHLVSGEEIVETVPTYRGLGHAF